VPCEAMPVDGFGNWTNNRLSGQCLKSLIIGNFMVSRNRGEVVRKSLPSADGLQLCNRAIT
jgi:hypothetical protein